MQLGELEKQVLHYLWQEAPASAKDVYSVFSKSRGGSLNTIQSTLDRLFKKELLSREKQGHAWLYSPRIERRQLIAKIITQVAEELAEHQENGLIAAFASMSEELDADQLDELEALIQKRRQTLKP
ncbi:BlaI/MecI/CopY family transcriptional regulator [Pseudoteredinibacter isoporae]|uniref:Putative transcriptional regulator n=1 Tax=Pseudoteredinibacter isoporae TaxID=570281 RepID=A0A7X0MVL6_9GAMM|nr:BlaI/MecI/CopY family transcriptional regulator [Pseudoteredinibacter isoporae]MBB6519979.1 putative transcriptional regulator [Pseudoteredinibacter isoporae]NHO85551.1 BlaI/MecI/CopY family transcriptional regulator [Pseudoteredinibacter isoporae]NIB25997.1 BlaI/MecI/CopY family transcriptional regulator [Pseudoteredinibacter isoporae]